MILDVLDQLKVVRTIKGGSWVKTKKRGWVTVDTYEDYLSYDFDPVLLKTDDFIDVDLIPTGTVIQYPREKRKWVVLDVSQDDIDNREVDVAVPGVYIFTGMWYGDDALTFDSMGKVSGLGNTVGAKVVGRITDFDIPALKKMLD